MKERRYKMNRCATNILVIMIMILNLSGISFGAAYSGGTGEPNNPYKISTVADWQSLMATTADWNKRFVLAADVNLAGVVVTPVGNSSTPFSGVLDGGGHSILNCIINMPSGYNYLGVFGYISGQLCNLAVKDVNIAGGYNVGGLVGCNRGIIKRCFTIGSVKGNSTVGGLVGDCLNGIVSDSYSACSVTALFSTAGGLVGGWGILTNCYSTGLVTGSYAGGLAGTAPACTNCFWDKETSGQPMFGVASQTNYPGVQGKTTVEMKTLSTFRDAGWDIADVNAGDADWIMSGQNYPKNIYFTYYDYSIPFSGDGSAQNPYEIWSPEDLIALSQCGLAWDNYIILMQDIDLNGFAVRPIGNSIIRFTGNFNGQHFAIRNAKMNLPAKEYVGLFGFVAKGAAVSNLHVDDVNISGKQFVGSLCGANCGTISNCSAYGSAAAGTLASYVGGLAGTNDGTISHCSFITNICGRGSTVGGLVGANGGRGIISDCNATGTVTDADPNNIGSCAGGLAGQNMGTISNSSANTNVNIISASSSGNIHAGAFVGDNGFGGVILNSFALGQPVHVTAPSALSNIAVGGLTGSKFYGDVNDCFSKASVICDANADAAYFVGGLTGISGDGGISRCYAAGPITANGSPETGYCVGGLTGLNLSGNIVACFWDTQATGKTSSAGGIGLTTAQMKTVDKYQNAGWAGHGWVINEYLDYPDYPFFAWQALSGTVALDASAPIPLLGSGTSQDPYQIWTVQDFAALNEYAGLMNGTANIALKADLDFSGVEVSPIGQVGQFKAKFDGQYHTIRNVTINAPTNSYVGLFGQLGQYGQINNLKLLNMNIVGGDYVGGLLGKNGTYNSSTSASQNGGTVSKCSANGSVAGFTYTGGLIGSNEGGTIQTSHSGGTVSAWNTCDPNTLLGGYFGGLAGNNSTSITDSYSTSAVSGGYYVGGLFGKNYGTSSESISRNYSAGPVSGTYCIGGFIGFIMNYGGSISSCYWDTYTSGKTAGLGSGSNTSGITGKPTFMMQAKYTFGGWDWGIWSICETTNYPRHKWSIPAADLACPDGVSLPDFSVFAQHWLEDNCAASNNCSKTDFDLSGTVDFNDLMVLCQSWLEAQ